MRRFFSAIAFLSRAPLPRGLVAGEADVGRATLWFPVVGALLGGLQALALLGLALRLPPLVAATLTVALGALATGALHLDGLADTADGFGGGHTRDQALGIMRDHAIGAYGATALVLLLGLKVVALAALATLGQASRTLIVSAALARWVAVPTARLLPYARPDGLGAAMRVGPLELIVATAAAFAIAVGVGGLAGAISIGAVSALGALVAWVSWKKIGGFTGDTLGAAVELAEALVYLVVLGLT